jgi:phosphoglucosamine mutase
VVTGDTPDGLNINVDCGSTHIERLKRLVLEHHLDVGFAFDGDADRCIAVDERGNEVNGDHILYVLGKAMQEQGSLAGNTVVTTIMSNMGLYRALEAAGMDYVQTTVGDRFVYESMTENGFVIGGEQSGHIILKKYATTGDGLLTALMITEEMCDRKSSLSTLAEPVMLYPQYLVNIRVKDKADAKNDPDVKAAVEEVEKLINGNGRVLIRESGTEPVIRVMIESETDELCREYAHRIADVIIANGHKAE